MTENYRLLNEEVRVKRWCKRPPDGRATCRAACLTGCKVKYTDVN